MVLLSEAWGAVYKPQAVGLGYSRLKGID